MPEPVEVRPVRTRADLKTFIRLPKRIYRTDSRWIAPLEIDLRKQLDRKKNPWFEHSRAEYFIAWRGKEPVGRITAQVDDAFNEFQNNEWGLFGFFEAIDDQAVTDALLDAAAAWLKSHGRDRMVGPMSFTTNDECGLLIEGFDLDPMILQPWNYPYYRERLEGAGLVKAMDTLMWDLRLSREGEVMDVLWQLSDKVDADGEFKLRHFDKRRRFQQDVDDFLGIYNASWERNWGFVPLNDHEARHYAKALKPVLDPHWAMLVHRGDETVGSAVTLPDFNQVLKHLNGRLLPFGWAKALWYKRKINEVRVFALGVKPAYQHTGVAARLYTEHYKMAHVTSINGGETGWILETNVAMNKAMQAMGGKIVKRYRFFERTL